MKVSPKKEFNENTHEYRVNGKKVPSVTQVIKGVFGVFEGRNADWYMQRGSAVHLAIHLLVNNQLDWESVDPRIKGYIEAFQKFLKETGYKPFLSEVRIFEHTLRFAGTADIFLTDEKNRMILGDFKSSITPTVSLQLGGYSYLWHNSRSDAKRISRLCAIQLNEDVSYNIKWFKDIKSAERLFISCLQIYNFKQLNNL